MADCSDLLATHPIEDLEIRASLAGLLVENRGTPPVAVFDLESLLGRSEGTPAGYYVARSLLLYGPPSAQRLAAKVAERTEHLIPEGAAERVNALGQVEPDSAILVSDPYGDSTVVCVEFNRTNDSGDASDSEGASVLINNTLGGIAGNFSYGIAATQDILDAVAADEDLVKTDITLDKARSLAIPAIDRRRLSVVESEEAMAIDELLGIVRQRFELLPVVDDPAPREAPEPIDIDGLVRRFVDSDTAAEYGEGSPNLEAIGREICGFASSLNGDPLRWSPAVAEMFFEGWMPTRDGGDPAWIEDQYLGVKAWVRWAGGESDLAPHLIAKTIETISEIATPEIGSLRLP